MSSKLAGSVNISTNESPEGLNYQSAVGGNFTTLYIFIPRNIFLVNLQSFSLITQFACPVSGMTLLLNFLNFLMNVQQGILAYDSTRNGLLLYTLSFTQSNHTISVLYSDGTIEIIAQLIGYLGDEYATGMGVVDYDNEVISFMVITTSLDEQNYQWTYIMDLSNPFNYTEFTPSNVYNSLVWFPSN